MTVNRSASKRRRSRPATRVLDVANAETDKRKHPRLSKRDDGVPWHPLVQRWWSDLWGSAAVLDLDSSDHFAVWQLADLYHQRMTARSPAEVVRLSTEARQLAQSLGLSPRARQIAKVEIAKGEQADDERLRRRNRRAAEVVVSSPAAEGEQLSRDEMLRRVREVSG